MNGVLPLLPIYLHGGDRDSVIFFFLQIFQLYVKYVRGNGGVANVASASQVVAYTVLLMFATRCDFGI